MVERGWKLPNGDGNRLRIEEYLRERAEMKGGARYFKSKHIAQDLGLSAKEVGATLGILQNDCDRLRIEKWGYSKSTTWRVELP
jgi:hypothetical protein